MSTSDRSGLVTLPFGRVYLRDVGPVTDAPPVVLLHGLLVSHYAYRGVIPHLSRTRRVLALDLPGCGESDRPDPAVADGYSPVWLADAVVDVLAARDVLVCDLVGHGLGGAVALCLAELAPQRVRRLVLADTLCFPLPMPLEGRLSAMPVIGPRLLKYLFRRADLRRYLRRTHSSPELLDEASVDLYWDRLRREGGPEAAHAMIRQLAALDHMRDRLPRVRAPTRVLWGDRDALTPLEHGERMAELIPDADLRVVDGCGHATNEERPDRFAAVVAEHLGIASTGNPGV